MIFLFVRNFFLFCLLTWPVTREAAPSSLLHSKSELHIKENSNSGLMSDLVVIYIFIENKNANAYGIANTLLLKF